ncbi:unnamed protein product [Nezara viridula]|uniref:Uncharacterized protein n=1 Tax=Nezara viridula TaxID=85310 RepID=A0A9P0E6H7_NEZVI|nr:unnamed protein product [Nezara viridula]
MRVETGTADSNWQRLATLASLRSNHNTALGPSQANLLPSLAQTETGQRVRPERRQEEDQGEAAVGLSEKRSMVVFPKVRPEDAGRYECRATSVSGVVKSIFAVVTVEALPASNVQDNTSSGLLPLRSSYKVTSPRAPDDTLSAERCMSRSWQPSSIMTVCRVISLTHLLVLNAS